MALSWLAWSDVPLCRKETHRRAIFAVVRTPAVARSAVDHSCTMVRTQDVGHAALQLLSPWCGHVGCRTKQRALWSWCQPWRVWICFACYRDGTRSGVVIVSTRTLPELQTLARFRNSKRLHHGTHSAPPVIGLRTDSGCRTKQRFAVVIGHRYELRRFHMALA